MARGGFAILIWFAGLSSCSVVLTPGEKQCAEASDCAARGFPTSAVCQSSVCVMPEVAVNPAWACLGDVPNPTPNPALKVSFTVQLTDTEEDPVSMATVDVCDKLDLDCTSTDPAYPKGLVSSANGDVALTVPQGFDGFVRISATNILDARVFVGRPLIKPPNVKSVRLIHPDDYAVIVAYAGKMVDMTRGTAILLAEDCQQNTDTGVSFTCAAADSQSQIFYLVNQAPEIPPTATTTDSDGFGGFLNLPVGATVATATLASTKQYIGQTSFDVLAYTISYVLITPTPM